LQELQAQELSKKIAADKSKLKQKQTNKQQKKQHCLKFKNNKL
jgi:hypothetical protein